jgi:RNA polymerase sigma-70 factor (ECF subfamily)
MPLSARDAALYAPPVPPPISPEDDDATLVARISAASPGRDALAEAEVCRRFGPRVRLFGLRHLRGDAAAADLTQEVLIIVLQKLREGAVRDSERLPAFVLGTARQCVMDWKRSTARRARILGTFPIDLPSLVEEAREPLDTDRLRLCLQDLAERERAVLVMTYYDGHSAEAVGSELGISAANVRVIRHRGIQRLRECMNLEEGSA